MIAHFWQYSLEQQKLSIHQLNIDEGVVDTREINRSR